MLRTRGDGLICAELGDRRRPDVPGSPAERAGLQAGDLLVELAGRRIEAVSTLQALLASEVIGTALPAVVLRDGRTLTVTVVPGELARSR